MSIKVDPHRVHFFLIPTYYPAPGITDWQFFAKVLEDFNKRDYPQCRALYDNILTPIRKNEDLSTILNRHFYAKDPSLRKVIHPKELKL